MVVLAVIARKVTPLALLTQKNHHCRYSNVTNSVVNMVAIAIRDNSNISSVSKKGTVNIVVTTTLVAVDLITLVINTTMLTKDVGVAIIVETLGI